MSKDLIKDYSPDKELTEESLDENNSLKKMLRLVGENKKVVEFGCASGYFSQLLGKKGCIVTGVELNQEVAKIAEQFCAKVIVADLDFLPVTEILPSEKFDVAVFGDVLEHLRNPWKVLEETKQLLKADGYVVASIPNIAHGAIRLALLQGRFEYEKLGILDDTHLRFFTLQTINELFERSGYYIGTTERTKLPIFSGSNLAPHNNKSDFDSKLIQHLEKEKEIDTLQFILRAYPPSIEGKYAALSEQYSRLVDESNQTQCQLKESQVELEKAQSQLRESQVELEKAQSQLRESQVELEKAQSQLRESQVELEKVQSQLRESQDISKRLQVLIAGIYSSKFWKLRKKWFKFKRVVRPLFNISTHHITPVPIQHLITEGNTYKQTGDSPQIILHSSRKELPCNWVLVSYSAEAEQGFLTPKLYIDSGNGFREEEATYLTTQVNSTNEYMIRLPQQVNGLRLDPISSSKSFTLNNLRIREISKLQAAWILTLKRIKPALSDPKKAVKIFRKGVSLIVNGKVPELKENLLSYEKNASGYQQWLYLYDILTKADRNAIHKRLIHLKYKPLISVVMPVYNPSEKWLRLAIDSVINQIYPHWELCIADDASPGKHVREILQEYQKKDARIKVVFRDVNGHISAASNSAIELVEGEFIALMDHDDELAEHALYMIAEELNNYPNADLIYSDEDKIDEQGQRDDPYFKSDWDPDLFCSQNLINHLGVYRTSLIRKVGGFRLGYEGSQDHDLALRIVEKSSDDRIRHIPHILYHWRTIAGSTALAIEEKDYTCRAARRAIESYFERKKIPAKVTTASDECKAFHRVIYPLPEKLPLVSLIIPTRDHFELLKGCVDSILNKTDYPNIELIIVDNQSQETLTLDYLEKLRIESNVRVIKYNDVFNYSAINNAAVSHASGDIIGLINNDIEVISSGWLREMVSHAVRPEIGVVGAKLYYGDNTIQHAGVVLGIGGVAGHVNKYLPKNTLGYRGQAVLLKNFSAVTGACLLMRHNVFKEVGGLDEKNLPIAFNDIDLCIRVRELGYRVLFTPYAELYHLESRSRGSDDTPKRRPGFAREVNYMRSRWGDVLLNDPFYNPNLTLNHEDFSLAFPPRSRKPWK